MNKLLYITAISLLTITSCKKKGCIDSNANNYSSEAKKDDGTCTYEASAVFWVHGATNLSIPADLLDIYIDGAKIGSMSQTSNYLYAPSCGSGGVTYYADLGSIKTKNIFYEIKYLIQDPGTNNYSEQTYTSGTTKITGGQCQPVEIN